MNRSDSHLIWVLTLCFACTFAALVGACLAGCGARQLSPAAEYEAEQLACVEQSATREESQICRKQSRAKWMQKLGIVDGGDAW